MIANPDPLAIASVESLESRIAEIVRLKIKRTAIRAEADDEVARLEKRFQNKLTALDDEIADLEAAAQSYCVALRADLFPAKKSRETALAEYGFELTPPRVETASKKITWKDVVARCQRMGQAALAYVRQPEPKPDKEALLADREKLSPEMQTAMGIRFAQDEQFFIRPKPETAQH